MRWLEYSGHGVPWFILVVLLFLLGNRSGIPAAVSLNLLTLLVVDLLLAATFKAIVQRPRPGYNDKGALYRHPYMHWCILTLLHCLSALWSASSISLRLCDSFHPCRYIHDTRTCR
jgi:hypothetical protein